MRHLSPVKLHAKIRECFIIKKKLGEKLGLPTFNHYYNIPITSLEYDLKT